jgi:hypothetical protein
VTRLEIKDVQDPKGKKLGIVTIRGTGSLLAQLAIDTGAGESTHVVFCFSCGRETSLAGELKMLPVGEFDMTLPCPCVGVPVFTDCCDDGLVTVRIGDFVPGSFLIIIAHGNHFSALRSF